MSSEEANTPVTEVEKDKLANGLFNVLKPTIEAIDANIQNVYDSQSLLRQQLSRLEGVMDEFQSVPTLIPLHPYSNKLSMSRLKLNQISADVQRVTQRLESIRNMVKAKQALNTAQGGVVLKEEDVSVLD